MARHLSSPIGPPRPIVSVLGSRQVVVTALVAGFLTLAGSTAAFATPGQFKAFALTPPGFGPQQIALGSDGGLWFTETAVASIGRLGNGAFSYVSLPGGERYASDIAAGPDGALWVTEPDLAEIARVTTAGVVTEFPIPPCNCGPYGEGAESITTGPDGALWYTRSPKGVVGRITTAGVVTEFTLPGEAYDPADITTGSDGALWFTDDVGVARITTDGTVTQFDTPFTYPSAIASGPDGNLWVTFPYSDVVARVRTSGSMSFFSLDLNCSPQDIAPVAGALWITCYYGNELERVTTTGHVGQVPIANQTTGYGIAAGANGSVWFSEDAVNSLARLSTH